MLHRESPWQVCAEKQLCLGLVTRGLSQLSGEPPKSEEGEWVFLWGEGLSRLSIRSRKGSVRCVC